MRTTCLVKRKKSEQTKPAATGEMTQERTILVIPSHLTPLAPKAEIPAPVMAPTIAWVVETGQPRDEANKTQVEEPIKAQTIVNCWE